MAFPEQRRARVPLRPVSGRTRPLVLLDLDGCLVDSREPILGAWNTALAAMGLAPADASDLDRYVGPPLQLAATELLRARGEGPAAVAAFIERYRADYVTRSIDLARSFPGVPEAVATLAGHAQLGVCTSKPTAYARPILDALGLTHRFDVVAGPGLTEAEPKTATMAGALEALGRTDVGPAGVMVGDRHHDVDAGRAHGLRTVGVLWGFGSEDELQDAGAHAIVATPSSLPDVVVQLLG